MVAINDSLTPAMLLGKIEHMWQLSADKIRRIQQSMGEAQTTPVFTVGGKYMPQGWTEWTQGFQFGSEILQFDATGDEEFLELGRRNTRDKMASHVSHIGVHDHGFNNISTYGNLRRLIREGRYQAGDMEQDFCEVALKVSGAIQAARWSPTHDGGGYIYSFNGPHSLFCDTIRSLRSLAMSYQLGHCLMGENDDPICLLGRLIDHARSTSQFNVYYGEGRDHYDVRGRVAHESIFNCNDGRYRCPSTQQGYTPFSTWTRGLSWVMCGYPEQLEFLATVDDSELARYGGRADIEAMMLRAACASCDFFLEHTPSDGICYWDTGAPGLAALGDYLQRPAEPDNNREPVDSSASAIAAQGLLRLGQLLQDRGEGEASRKYMQAGLTVLDRLLEAPYLSEDAEHEGLLLHTVYHRPRGWDHIPQGKNIPFGESCMWGDYHLREVALYVQRLASEEPYLTFFA